MKTGLAALSLLVLLAACGREPPVPYVRLITGEAPEGPVRVTIFATDQAEIGVGTRKGVRALPEGSYARARALVERDFPRIFSRQAALREARDCPDVGEATVQAQPAASGIAAVGWSCGEDGVLALVEELRAIVPR
ncbi:hypothetical protein [Histidinibacterium aquaticum]|uniref:Lipoprotein n=1 Tax=Histidinibacterium aquaticum TaxID=2613962 RepID=A0A5J5GLM4_9RHOB|nr:hypothetical protein [Histidinibacterium aquaticum]KAA9008927.1 hypothetical protein F3S47_06595 [Histidinibacterium aquaticum]